MNNQFANEGSVFTESDFVQGFGLEHQYEQDNGGDMNFGMNNNSLDMGLINEESFLDVTFPFDGLTQRDMGNSVDANNLASHHGFDSIQDSSFGAMNFVSYEPINQSNQLPITDSKSSKAQKKAHASLQTQKPVNTSPFTQTESPTQGNFAQFSPASPDFANDKESLNRVIAAAPSKDGSDVADTDRRASEEDKRRRNTAASARFRVKKKAREQAMEQTAKEMTDRVKLLENRVNSLEAENKFLRELITEKEGRSVDFDALRREKQLESKAKDS